MEMINKYYNGHNQTIVVEDCNVLKTDTIVPNTGNTILLDSTLFSEPSMFKKKVLFESQVEFADEVIFNNDKIIKNLVNEMEKYGSLMNNSKIVSYNDASSPILFYSKEYNDMSNLNDQNLLIPPNISKVSCIFYLVVMYNNGTLYSKYKFYYKAECKNPFEIIYKENINCDDQNKTSLKYSDGSINIGFKYNKSLIKNIKIKVYYSDI